MDDMIKMIAGLVVRHGMTALAGVLVSGGLLTKGAETSWTETTVGIVLGGLGLFWSWWQKSGQQAVLAKFAKMHGAAPQSSTTAEAAKLATDAVKVASVMLLAVMLAAALATPALAQTKRPPLTGNIPADIANAVAKKTVDSSSQAMNSTFTALAKPFQDIAQFIGDDADGAIALATAVPEIQDGHGQQCWMAMASFGRIVKAHPVPLTLRVMTDLEALRLLGIAANKLCTNVHCTQVFADQTAMIQAASPVPLPLPSLHDLCTKVPQIAVVDALATAVPATVPVPTP